MLVVGMCYRETALLLTLLFSEHLISILRTYLWEFPPSLASPITAILQNSHATPGDIFAVSFNLDSEHRWSIPRF